MKVAQIFFLNEVIVKHTHLTKFYFEFLITHLKVVSLTNLINKRILTNSFLFV